MACWNALCDSTVPVVLPADVFDVEVAKPVDEVVAVVPVVVAVVPVVLLVLPVLAVPVEVLLEPVVLVFEPVLDVPLDGLGLGPRVVEPVTHPIIGAAMLASSNPPTNSFKV
jgi:hypothetical protein